MLRSMLRIQNISKQYGSKVLFHEAEAMIDHRSRVALIGPNGAGKSTLIRMILGEEYPDEGQILKVPQLSIGHLPQDLPKMTGRTVLTEVMRLDGRRDALLSLKQDLEKAFESEASTADLERYGRIQEELEHLDEYKLESRAKAILSGMGFKNTDYDRSLSQFSGGWLMRIALSRILLLDPDLLLLDEPTNHLDLESLLWLEEFLQRSQGAMLIISHDAIFLNKLVREVWEIDQKKIWTYKGNLTAAESQKEERLTLLRAQYEAQQNKIEEIESFVERFGAKATKARQAQSRLKQLEKMELIELPEDVSKVRFRFPPAPHSGKEIVNVEHMSLSFGPRTLFRDLNFQIRKGTRTAIVGINGAGKTTLLRLLAHELAPSEGQARFGHEVKVGYYSQHQAETLNMNASVTEELEATAPHLPIAQVRAIAGAFLFSGDAVHKKCGVLSGGEKARVALAKLLLSPSNFLLLDEPTNHLDMASKKVLLQALQDYDGTLCVVSHDREFIGPLADRLLEIEAFESGSQVHFLNLTYPEYIERKIREAKSSLSENLKDNTSDKGSGRSGVPTSSNEGPGKTGPKKSVSNNQRQAWKKEHAGLETKIAQLEETAQKLAADISNPEIYNDKTKLLAALDSQRQTTEALSQAYDRWEELSRLLEEAGE